MRMRVTLTLVAVLGCLLMAASVSSAQTKTVSQLFSQALKANGADYVSVRSAIIARKAEALPFLKSKASDPDWHVRVLARAIVSHADDPQTYSRCEEIIMTKGGPSRFHAPSFYDHARGGPFDPEVGSTAKNRLLETRNQYREASWLWFLAEIALKNSVLCKPLREYDAPSDDSDTLYTKEEVAGMLNVSRKAVDSWMHGPIRSTRVPGKGDQAKSRDVALFAKEYLQPDSSLDYRESVRCWAMLTLSSFTDNPAVISLLTELLQSRESTEIRGYAAIALGQSGDPRAAQPLIRASHDPDSQVREAVQRSLNRLYEIIEETRQSDAESKRK